MSLNTTERNAIRLIAEGKHADVSTATIRRLKERGLLEGRSRLTTAGRRAHTEIMSSGDGPEDLKDLMRF